MFSFGKSLFLAICSTPLLAFASYPYRPISSPVINLPENVKIVQCSPPRTGSTLVYNVLKYLFERDPDDPLVIKTHRTEIIDQLSRDGYEVFIFSTLRDIEGQVHSRLTSKEVTAPSSRDLLKEKRKATRRTKRVLRSILRNRKASFLSFDSLLSDWNYLYSQIEDLLEIEIPKEEKVRAYEHFNRQAMHAIASKFTSFDEYDPHTHIHGNHLSTEEDGRR